MNKSLAAFRNRVFNSDVLATLRRMPASSVDMVYGDPDYNVGVNYAGKKYTRQWEDYMQWYADLCRECLRVLKPTGNLFMINYPKQNAHLRARFLDENAREVWDYAWVYNTNVGHSPRRFTTAHRSILHAVKSDRNAFYKDQVALPYQNPNDKRIAARMAEGHKGRMPYSWFYFDLVKNVSKDKTFHACQIPLPLFRMLLCAATRAGDDVFVLFGGSGAEVAECQAMRRNFVCCELHPPYYRLILRQLKSSLLRPAAGGNGAAA